MEQAADDPWLIALGSVSVLGSAAAWIWILSKWRTSGVVLPYVPRRATPWGPGAALPALVFTLLAVMQALSPAAAEQREHIRDGQEIASSIAAMLLLQLFLSGGFFFVIALMYRATAQDFGLPRSGREALRDVAIGIITCLAAFLPVGAALKFLQRLTGRENDLSQHQLIQMITGADAIDAWVMLLACISAVVVAPFCEEIAFRLLFQGWLEKCEDEQLELRAPDESRENDNSATGPITMQNDEARMTNDEILESADSSFVIRHSSFRSNLRPARGLAGLRHGWLPILVSSVLFGLAHAGYGPEPVPLFLFGILLGYVFQRTSRILPCIVAHALFNAMTMLALWRMIVQGAN